MATKIDCLRLLSLGHLSHYTLASHLHITSLKLLELISQINKIESLIDNRYGDRLCLTRAICWLDLARINDNFTNPIVNDYIVQILDEVDSTNDYALKNLNNLKSKTVITAEYQSLGRARNGKYWVTKIAYDITASFVFYFDLYFKYELLPIIMAAAVNRLFKQLRIVCKIKWPNDIMLPDKTKIAGILVESCIRDNQRCVVIGIGIDNISAWDRNNLFASLIQSVSNLICEYERTGFDLIYHEWLNNCIHYNHLIKLYQGDSLLVEGIHLGLSSNGGLIIKTTKGEQKEYHGGSISLIF